MAADLNNEKVITRYLLGELPEEQQVEIEDRAFADQEYLASITAVENDLIDEYVRRELSETERLRFESRFLASAERRKRVEFAKALAGVVSEAAAPAQVVSWSWRESLSAFLSGLNPAAKVAFATAAILPTKLIFMGVCLFCAVVWIRGVKYAPKGRPGSYPDF